MLLIESRANGAGQEGKGRGWSGVIKAGQSARAVDLASGVFSCYSAICTAGVKAKRRFHPRLLLLVGSDTLEIWAGNGNTMA